MIIEEVKIRDFRSHKNTTVQFDEGIHVIVGDNGSGKTSILDAINFALFKQKPNKDVNVDDLIRRGAEECEVSVVFHSNGKKYKAVRGRKIGKAHGSGLYLLENGETLLVRGEDEVTKEIEEILKVNGDLFTSAIYIKQGEIDRLISATPSTRKEHIGKLLGTEDLERAYQKMVEILRDYRIKIEGYRKLPEELEDRKKKIEKETEEINLLKGELEKIETALEAKKQEFVESEKKIKNLEELQRLESEKKIISRDLSHLKENIERIETAEKELKTTEEAHERFLELEEEIERLQEEKIRLKGLIEKKESIEADLEADLEKLENLSLFLTDALNKFRETVKEEIPSIERLKSIYPNKLKEVEKREKDIESKREKILSQINELKGQNIEVEKAIKELKEAQDKCPTCGKPLTPADKESLLEEYTKKVHAIEAEILKNQELLNTLQKEERKIEELLRSLKEINIELLISKEKEKKDLQNKISEAKNAITQIQKEIEKIEYLNTVLSKKEEEKERLRKENEKYISAKRFLKENLPEKERYQAKIKFLEEKIIVIDKKIEEITKTLGYIPSTDELWNARDRHRNIWSDLTNLEKKKSEKESIISEKRRNILQYKEEIETLKREKQEAKKLEEFITFLEKIRQLFHKDSLQRDLRVHSKPLIEKYTREIFDRFNLPYSDISLTDDYSMTLYSPHGEESVDMLSGGERIASALALRIGIAKALSGPAMELIILDEPTIHLDAQRRQELVEIIRKLSSLPQTIVVTHDKEFEQAADRLITVEKINGISRVNQGSPN